MYTQLPYATTLLQAVKAVVPTTTCKQIAAIGGYRDCCECDEIFQPQIKIEVLQMNVPTQQLALLYVNVHCSSDEGALRFSQRVESVKKDVECTFGILKKRWRILKNPMFYDKICNNMEACNRHEKHVVIHCESVKHTFPGG